MNYPPVHPINVFEGASHPHGENGKPLTTRSGWLTSVALRRGFTEFRHLKDVAMLLEWDSDQNRWAVVATDFRKETLADGTNVLRSYFMSLNQARREYVRLCKLAMVGEPLGFDSMVVRSIPASEVKDGDLLRTSRGAFRATVVNRHPMVCLNLADPDGVQVHDVKPEGIVRVFRRESEWAE